ncbi:MAG: T9SS type A sorting domain-containing protein [Bacteroidales bacterium]
MEKIKKYLFLFLLFVFLQPYLSYSQTNLIRNYSFEDHTNCPYARNQIHFANYWYNPCNGGTDYFNACAFGISPFWTPLNGSEFQYPRTGVAHAAIYLFYGNNYREYVGTTLEMPLVRDKIYTLRFYVNLANGSRLATDQLGAAVIKDSCICDHTSIPIQYLLNYQPQVCSPKGVVLADTLNWMEVSGSFKAEGGEKHLIIGNFFPYHQNNVQMVGDSNAYPVCYYFIDDVFLSEADSVSSGFTEPVPMSIGMPTATVIPNPATARCQVSFATVTTDPLFFEMYTVTGQRVLSATIPGGSLKHELDLSQLPPGLYTYGIHNHKGARHGKIVVQ